jgi:DNA mismatch repair protein MutS
MAQGGIVETPLMKQYYSIKDKHPEAILLFRVGDFYETFGEDAIKTSGILGITLTKRANGAASYVELAGFPHHALDTYLPKLVRAGQRVAICEQLEDPKLTKNIVKRGITELVTPGLSLNDNVLQHKENNFLASIHFEKDRAGISFLDISTGEFFVAEGNFEYIDKLLSSFNPREVLFERGKKQQFTSLFGEKFYTFKLDDWIYKFDTAQEKLLNHFGTASLKGFGIHQMNLGIVAAGSVLHYLTVTQHSDIKHIAQIRRIEESQFVWLDKFTIRNLELLYSMNEGAKTLVGVLDRTLTPMGGRLLKRWVALPLKDIRQINNRLDIVEYLMKNPSTREVLNDNFQLIGDLERLITKVATGRINPREVGQLKTALESLLPIKHICERAENEALRQMGEQFNPCLSLIEKITKQLNDEPPVALAKGNVFRTGFNEALDELRQVQGSGKAFILEMQKRECERTGITSLKISFNNVFGYYIEVRNTHKDKVPAEWIRKQTLVSAERYITDELKDYEAKVLGAEEKIACLEAELFGQLISDIASFTEAIQLNANLIAKLDCLHSFACISNENRYYRPLVDEGDRIDIKEGRHPVIEKELPLGEEYITNDVFLDTGSQQIIMITGPNMSGKSALLRQTALIVLMAQMGCFVPAQKAEIGYVDKVFTRVGASDNISLGESTFMVEMTEAASILNNLSDRSLILLDEIGRGTSTYDGISIAWAMAEYIHEHMPSKAKTLFATHYHELNEMENAYPRIKNYNVSVKEMKDKVIFLRKLKKGGSEHSFGIHVAQMAGMPKSVVKRAGEILKELEKSHEHQSLTKPVNEIGRHREGFQMSFFQLEDPVLKQIRDEIKNIDVNNLTPVEALNKLNEIKKITGL